MPRTDPLRTLDDDDVWASSAPASDRSLDARDTEPPLTVSAGYGSVYDADGGSKITREQMNEMFYRLTTLVAELNKHGVFEWHAGGTYDHPCIATWGGVLYITKQDAPSNQRPDLDFARVYWERVAPLASDTVPGLVELATDAEADAASTSSGATDLHVTNLRQSARLATRLINSLVPDNHRLPTPSGHTGQYLAGNRTWRALRDELAGLLLPAAAGTANQVLGHDKTFGYPPSGFTRETIREEDRVVDKGHMFEFSAIGTEALDEFDELEMMVRSPENTDYNNTEDPDNLRGRSMAVMRVSPRLIPQYSDPGLRNVVDGSNRNRKEGLLWETPPMFHHEYQHGDALPLRYWFTRLNSGTHSFHGLAAVYDPQTGHGATWTWHYALYGLKYGDFTP